MSSDSDAGTAYASAALSGQKHPTTVSAILEQAETIRAAVLEHERRADACREAIRHIDFVLAYCDWEIHDRKISRRHTIHARHLRSGLITRLVMTALRNAERPITAREILGIISGELRSKSTKIGQRRLDNAIRSSLKCKEQQGIVISEKRANCPQAFRILLVVKI